MSKTIEFVDNEIKFCQLKINKAKEEKVYRETMALLFPENKNINLATVNEIEISLNEYKIKCLQQIKCELEAWEVCKNKLNLKVQTEEAVTEGFCMKGYWLLVEQYPYTQTTIIEQEEYEILKKALEVEDE